VFEKEASLHAKPRDWNMGLHWGAPVLRSLIGEEDANSRVQSVQVDPNEPTKHLDTLMLFNGATGEQIGGATVDYFFRLRRSKLRDLLSEGTDICFNKRLANITYSSDRKLVTAHFDDGSSATGRIILGADGARSAVRKLIVRAGAEAAESKRLPVCATFIQARYTAEQAVELRKHHPLYLAGIHPRGHFAFFGMQDASDAKRPETWTFFFYISWNSSLEEQDGTAGWTDRQRLDQAKAFVREGKFADPWKSAYERLPEDTQVWYMSMTDWDPDEKEHGWDNHGGLVTLAGDAAHTMTYQRGQGLNHSISDAGRLVTTIRNILDGTQRQEDAVADYEKEMIARSGEEVRMSRKNTLMLHDWEKAIQSPLIKRGMHKQHSS
jgi:2-polyprenyl-6-methoxyphenol hydroxylase-like FAD-dependent oxidoreductase